MAQKGTKTPPPLQFSYFSGSSGVIVRYGPPKGKEEKELGVLKGAGVWEYSPNGAYIAGCLASCVKVYAASDFSLIAEIPAVKASKVYFSPRSTYVCVWNRSQKKADGKRDPNFTVYDIKNKKVMASWTVINVNNWPSLQWSNDESIAVRLVNSALHIFHGDDLHTSKVEIKMDKLKSFRIGKGKKDKRIAAFVPEFKSNPGVVKIFCVTIKDGQWACREEASKTFFRASDVSYYWNSKSTSLLVRAQTDVDAQGRSYYGESRLYYLRPNQQTPDIKTKGVIHMVDWEPNGDFFAVAHGDMPHVNITIYHRNGSVNKRINLKSARNYVKFSPCGRLLIVGAFGSLSGDLNVYDWKAPRLVGYCRAYCASHVEWSPDSKYILTAVLSPRMRVDNGVKIFKRDGSQVLDMPIDKLYKIGWRPAIPGVYPKDALNMPTKMAPAANSKGGVYRPPSARSGSSSIPGSQRAPTTGGRFIPGSTRSVPGGQRSVPGGQRYIPGATPASDHNTINVNTTVNTAHVQKGAARGGRRPRGRVRGGK